jgi:hypothetical protein
MATTSMSKQISPATKRGWAKDGQVKTSNTPVNKVINRILFYSSGAHKTPFLDE